MVCCEAEEHVKMPPLRQRVIWYLHLRPSRISRTPGNRVQMWGAHSVSPDGIILHCVKRCHLYWGRHCRSSPLLRTLTHPSGGVCAQWILLLYANQNS